MRYYFLQWDTKMRIYKESPSDNSKITLPLIKISCFNHWDNILSLYFVLIFFSSFFMSICFFYFILLNFLLLFLIHQFKLNKNETLIRLNKISLHFFIYILFSVISVNFFSQVMKMFFFFPSFFMVLVFVDLNHFSNTTMLLGAFCTGYTVNFLMLF